jgi:ribose transport system permease protein
MSSTTQSLIGSADGAGSPSEPPEGRTSSSGSVASVVASVSNYSLPVLLIALAVVFSLLQPATFATVANLKTILTSNSVLGILAIGTLLPLLIGQFDLSVGANLGFGSILVTGLASKSGLSAAEAIPAALVATTLVGLANGALVAYGGIDAFVTTLGMSSLLAGVTIWYTNGQSISTNIPTTLTEIGQNEIVGVPVPVIILAVVVAVAAYAVHATPLGRYLYALGGSREASRLSGLNVSRLTVLTFTVTGLLAGIAGVVEAGEIGTGNPVVGPPFLLPAFAAVFLGATSFRRGTFNVAGTIVAVFTIAVGINGLEASGVPSFVEPVFTGGALIVAAVASRWLNRERTSR